MTGRRFVFDRLTGRSASLRAHWRTGRGQVYVEYIVILIFTVVAIIGLTAPLGSNPSALDQLVNGLKLFWDHYSYLISLP